MVMMMMIIMMFDDVLVLIVIVFRDINDGIMIEGTMIDSINTYVGEYYFHYIYIIIILYIHHT